MVGTGPVFFVRMHRIVVTYNKPHRTYSQQLEILAKRGLECDDADGSTAFLQRIGYYRLSAYSYPLREPINEELRETPVQHRGTGFRAGYSFGDVIKLYEFDSGLRRLILEGVEHLEVALRVQISYTLGESDPLGHLDASNLDSHICNLDSPDSSGESRHSVWLNRYEKLQHDAASEDFVKHYILKYDGIIPIWVATEFLDFGTLVRLYHLMRGKDRNVVARVFGAKTGRTFEPWLRSLNHVRNTCAHHARLWNRSFTYALPKTNIVEVGADLHHLALVSNRQKLYAHAAVLAYALRGIDPETRWPTHFKERIKKFPTIDGLSPHRQMGFPDGWARQSLWRP